MSERRIRCGPLAVIAATRASWARKPRPGQKSGERTVVVRPPWSGRLCRVHLSVQPLPWRLRTVAHIAQIRDPSEDRSEAAAAGAEERDPGRRAGRYRTREQRPAGAAPREPERPQRNGRG